MTTNEEQERATLEASQGDVLFSRQRIPYPGLILQGFKRQRRNEPEIEPYVSFRHIRKLMEFLEFVVLTERIIVPIPKFSAKTEKIVNGRRHWVDFALFEAVGDLDLDVEIIIDKLIQADVLYECEIATHDTTTDEVAVRLTSSSNYLRSCFMGYLRYAEGVQSKNHFAFASASMAHWFGAPLQVAEMAGRAQIPYVLAEHQERHLASYERESLRTRKSVTELLLDRLNAGARKEISKLSEFGVLMSFPETPIASLIIRNASSPMGLVDAALQLRSKFAGYRKHIVQIESDLVNTDISLKTRIRRANEIKILAAALWPEARHDLRTTAIGVSEALASLPEVVHDPSGASIGGIVTKLVSLPVDRLVELYRRRRVRLLLKAKRQFLRAPDLTLKLAKVLDVPAGIVARSRSLDGPQLTQRYMKRHPGIAAGWYESQKKYRFKNKTERS